MKQIQAETRSMVGAVFYPQGVQKNECPGTGLTGPAHGNFALPDLQELNTPRMQDVAQKKTYTFFMPQEERFFFRYFHVITLACLLAVVYLGVTVSKSTVGDAVMFALILVAPMYALRLIYGKRFAESVALDFHARKARFSFCDDRGSIERNFQEIKKIYFRFYLTFVLDDVRIMVKRPHNKKEVFRLLQNVSEVDVGIFKGF